MVPQLCLGLETEEVADLALPWQEGPWGKLCPALKLITTMLPTWGRETQGIWREDMAWSGQAGGWRVSKNAGCEG